MPGSGELSRVESPAGPSAMTCCRFSSLKTLAMLDGTKTVRHNVSAQLIGRSWVTAEAAGGVVARGVELEHAVPDAGVGRAGGVAKERDGPDCCGGISTDMCTWSSSTSIANTVM